MSPTLQYTKRALLSQSGGSQTSPRAPGGCVVTRGSHLQLGLIPLWARSPHHVLVVERTTPGIPPV